MELKWSQQTEAGDLWLYGELHLFLANVYWAQGNETKAQTFLKEGRTVHDSGSLILCLEELADVVAGQGEPPWAARL